MTSIQKRRYDELEAEHRRVKETMFARLAQIDADKAAITKHQPRCTRCGRRAFRESMTTVGQEEVDGYSEVDDWDGYPRPEVGDVVCHMC